ncbi:MAG: potassium transporter TrkG, partial [Bacillota bacterium]|nr:potassium transporter TrkG [Bacillota bacterium]
VLGTVLYRIAGMKVFEGILHTMSALSTAGFSTRAGSIGEYGSFGIELVTIFLMLIGITNFGVLMLCVKGKFRQVIRLSEIRFMGVFLGTAILLIAASLYFENGMGVFESIRAAALNTLSALSTTGYSTLSIDTYSPFAFGIIIIAMLVGGGMGSTAGGLKLIRTHILIKMGLANLRRRIYSRRQVEAMYYTKIQGKTLVDASLMSDVTGFAITYFIVYIAGSLLLCLSAGCGLEEGLFEFAAAFSTSGLSTGITGTHMPAAALVVEMIGMILGRLEIFIVLTGVFSFVSLSGEKLFRKLHR